MNSIRLTAASMAAAALVAATATQPVRAAPDKSCTDGNDYFMIAK